MSTSPRPPRTSAAIKRFDVWFGGIFLAIGLAALVVSAAILLGLRPGSAPGRDTWSYLGGPLAVSAGFTVLGGILFGIGLRKVRREARILQVGTTTEATVSAVEPTNTRVNRRRLWCVRYSYEDMNGGLHAGDSGYLTAEDAQSYRVGEQVFIRYDPASPATSIWLGREELPGAG
jgi:hypothetical protein